MGGRRGGALFMGFSGTIKKNQMVSPLFNYLDFSYNALLLSSR